MSLKECYKMNTCSNRNNAIDVISGVFILEIIFDHILTNAGYNQSSYKYMMQILPAFMPWFFFKAGIMYKHAIGVRNTIRDRAQKLLYPFIIWSLIPCVIMLPLMLINKNFISYLKIVASSLYYAHGPFNTPLWFLASLFFTYIVKEYIEKYKLKSGGVIIITLFLSYLLNKCNLRLPLGMTYLPLGVLYFEFGTCCQMRACKLSKEFLLVLLMIYLFLVIYCPSLINFHKNELVYGNYFMAVFITLLFLFMISEVIHKKWDVKYLSYIGRNSLVFYVAHAPIIVIIKFFNDYYFHCSKEVVLLTMFLGVFVVIALSLTYYKNVYFLFRIKK